MTRIEYVLKYAPYVVEALIGKDLFPSVMMAQALLESADGNGVPGASLLASKYNNHFGIKADASWKGEKVSLLTSEFVNGVKQTVKDWFRVYTRATRSFDDRIKFLFDHPRYHKGGVFYAKDAYSQAVALQRSGYATDPHYATKLGMVIRKLNLEKLDTMGFAGITALDIMFGGRRNR